MGLPFNSLGLAACVLGVVVGVLAFSRPDLQRWWTSRVCFALPLILALFVFQRVAIRANFQLWNPDESEMIAGALTLQERPVFWRDVDGNSHGPLNQLPLLLPSLVGARIDYTSARVMAALLTIGLLLCLHEIIADWTTEGVARLLILPGWAFFIFNQDPETAQYTSEMPSCLLVALGLLFAARSWREPSASPWTLAWAGLCCGAAPLGKLQSAPMALWILVFLTAQLAFERTTPARDRGRRFAWLFTGAIVPTLIFVGLAAACGAFEYFRTAYLETNLLGYVLEGGLYFSQARPLPGTLFGLNEFLWPVAGMVVLGTVALFFYARKFNWSAFGLTSGLFAATVFAIYAPNKPFAHYFIFVIGPMLLLAGMTAGPVLVQLGHSLSTRLRLLLAGMTVMVMGLPVVVHHFENPDFFRIVLPSRPQVSRELITALQNHTSPGEAMAVWGWQPALYVFTQTVSATRNVIVFWPAVQTRWRDYYQATYLRDLQTHPPVVFVDTMGPADFFFQRAQRYRHENYPALAAYVDQNYVLDATVAGARIYVRRDRAALPKSAL